MNRIEEHGAFSSRYQTRRPQGNEVPRRIFSCSFMLSRRDAVYMECVIMSMCVASCGTDAVP